MEAADEHSDDYVLPAPTPELLGGVFLDRETIAGRVRDLGQEISRDYAGDDLLLVSVLKGAIFFLADLARAVDLDVALDFLAISSYADEQMASGPDSDNAPHRGIRFLKDLDAPVEGKHLLVVEDIIDTGLTLHYVLRALTLRSPASLAVCTLLDRPYRRLVDIPARYCGFTVPDDFFVGYGFDYLQHFRDLPDIHFLRI